MNTIVFILFCFEFIANPFLSVAQHDAAFMGALDPIELELAKDITSLVTEATLKSKCDGNVFVVSKECQAYIGLTLISMSRWAPPITIVSYSGPKTFPEDRKRAWNKFLAWHRRPCSLIFICDLVKPPLLTMSENSTDAQDEADNICKLMKSVFVNAEYLIL
jgi:hypothetical protein